MKKNNPIYVVLGTRAQFIKVAPIMREMLDRGIAYSLIYTAQHQEDIYSILETYKLPNPNIILYQREEANTKGKFISWFLSVSKTILFHSGDIIPKPGILLTHGDTFSTWMAAILGKLTGCEVGHIESGARSFNLFNPFPEEISRLVTFVLSDMYFCSDDWSMENLNKYKGEKINIGANTMIDGVRFALEQESLNKYSFQDRPYVVASIHRYENIFSNRLEEFIIPNLEEIAKKYHIVFALHPTTRERLIDLHLYGKLENNKNITLHKRFDFIDWVHVCNHSEFVISDGGSNQEELSYLGIPTLLFRNRTERKEGLGRNVLLSNFDQEVIEEFVENLENYRFPPRLKNIFPSKKIVDAIVDSKR